MNQSDEYTEIKAQDLYFIYKPNKDYDMTLKDCELAFIEADKTKTVLLRSKKKKDSSTDIFNLKKFIKYTEKTQRK